MSDNIQTTVIHSIVVAANRQHDTATMPTSVCLRETLGLDSMDYVEITLELEEHLGVRIDDVQMSRCDTVQNVVDLVKECCLKQHHQQQHQQATATL